MGKPISKGKLAISIHSAAAPSYSSPNSGLILDICPPAYSSCIPVGAVSSTSSLPISSRLLLWVDDVSHSTSTRSSWSHLQHATQALSCVHWAFQGLPVELITPRLPSVSALWPSFCSLLFVCPHSVLLYSHYPALSLLLSVWRALRWLLFLLSMWLFFKPFRSSLTCQEILPAFLFHQTPVPSVIFSHDPDFTLFL